MRSVVPLRGREVAGVERVIAQRQVGLEPMRAVRVRRDEVLVRLLHLVEVAELPGTRGRSGTAPRRRGGTSGTPGRRGRTCRSRGSSAAAPLATRPRSLLAAGLLTLVDDQPRVASALRIQLRQAHVEVGRIVGPACPSESSTFVCVDGEVDLLARLDPLLGRVDLRRFERARLARSRALRASSTAPGEASGALIGRTGRRREPCSRRARPTSTRRRTGSRRCPFGRGFLGAVRRGRAGLLRPT